MFSSVSHLSIVDGPYVELPSVIQKTFRSLTAIPLDSNWIFEYYQSSVGCVPPTPYLNMGLTCNIFYNYGQHMQTILILLVSGVILQVMTSIVNKLVKQSAGNVDKRRTVSNSFRRQINRFNYNYGFRFLVMYLKAISIELLVYSMPSVLLFKS